MNFDFFTKQEPARLDNRMDCPVLDIHSLIYGSMSVAVVMLFIFINLGGF